METLDVRIKNRVLLWLNSYELYERPPDPKEEEKKKQLEAEAEAKRQADEAEAKRLADAKVERKRIADEAEEKRLADAEAIKAKEAKELADAAEEKRKKYAKTKWKAAATVVSTAVSLAKKAEEKARLAEEARLAEVAYEKRLEEEKAASLVPNIIEEAKNQVPPEEEEKEEMGVDSHAVVVPTETPALEEKTEEVGKSPAPQEKTIEEKTEEVVATPETPDEPILAGTSLADTWKRLTDNDKLKKQIFDRLLKTALSSPYSGGGERGARGRAISNILKTIKDAAIATPGKIKEAANYIDDSVKKSAMNGLSRLAYSVEYKQFNVFEDQPIVDYIATEFKTNQEEFINKFSTIMPDITVNSNKFYTEASFKNPPTVTKKLFDENAPNIWFDISNNEKIFAHFESVFDNQIIQQPTYDGLEKLFTHETRGIRFDLYFTILSGFYPDKIARTNMSKSYDDVYREALLEQYNADFESINEEVDRLNKMNFTHIPFLRLAKLYILYRRLKPYLYFISKIDTDSDISSAVVEDKKPDETIVKRQHQLLIIPYTYRIVMRDENNVILTESFVHATKQVLHVIKVVLSEDTEPVIHYMMFKPPNNTITKSPPPKLYTARVEPILPVPDKDETTNGLSREDVIQQNLTKMNENTIQEVRETNLGIHESYVFANVKDYKEITTGKMVENCQYIFGRDDLADVYKHIPSFIRKTIGDIQ